MKKFLIVLLCILCVLGLSGLSVWLINRSIDTEEEIFDDSSEFDDGFDGNTSTQEDDKEDSSESSDFPSGDESPETNIYFTLPDRFTSGDYLLDLNERVQVVPCCYPDYTYFTGYIVWTSSNPNVVSIQPLEDLVSSCYLIGESEGYSTITATYEDQSISFEVGVSLMFGVVNNYVYYDYEDFNIDLEARQVFLDGSEYRIPTIIYTVSYNESDLLGECGLYCDGPFSDYISFSYDTLFYQNDLWTCYFGIYFEYARLCKDLGVSFHPSFSFFFTLTYERVLEDDPYTHYFLEYSFNLLFEYGGYVTMYDCSSPFLGGCNSCSNSYGGIV